PTDTVDPKFIFWVSRSQGFRDQLRVAATGVTRFGLRAEALANADIDLPPLNEQRRIADFLDTQVALLDRAITLRQRQSSLMSERLESDLRGQLASQPAEHWVALRRLGVRVTTGPFGTVFSAADYV